MEASNELRELTEQIYQEFGQGNVTFVANHLSQAAGVLMIGTDPQEWWTDYERIVSVLMAQVQEMGEFSLKTTALQCYSTGAMGWAADQPTLTFADGSELKTRLSIVYERDLADWKIVHWHISTGIANEDVLGKTLTV